MKMRILLISFIFMFFAASLNAQQDTITGWDFSDNTDVEFTANMGLTGNQGYDIRAEDTLGDVRTLCYNFEISGFSASVADWDNGSDNKFWSIKFKADGFTNMMLYSKQSSDATNPGPKNWKIQCRKSGDAWVDVTGGTVVVDNDWTTGVVSALELPGSFDLPGTTSLYVRWIMTSNESVDGNDVLPAGISKIDDIIITGLNSVGIETVIFENNVSVYPNPASDIINIESIQEIKKVELFDINGSLVHTRFTEGYAAQLRTGELPAGLYLLTVHIGQDGNLVTRRLIIE